MPTVEGYKLDDLLHSGQHSRVYRGRRLHDGLPVVIKVLEASDATLERRARLRREHEILCGIDSQGVTRAVALERRGERDALVLEDFGGRSLRDHVRVGEPMEIAAFLRLALRVTAGLEAIHRSGVIHRDIKPSNILVNETTGRVAITDFSISSQISREQPTVEAPTRLEGTLAYIAPEQTGRMNRSVDYRSDYYSLGVTFYQLLAGTLPFTTPDPAELVHAHIALTPTPPELRRVGLPKTLSRIVLKLMEKNAEERYQSARGLVADLGRCLKEWTDLGEITSFKLGDEDVSEQFQIPERLYGRDQVVAELRAAFERCAGGAVEIVLLVGDPGVGKSAIAHELLRTISGRHGFFGAGKFEQLGSPTPHAGLAQALRSVLRQMLSLPAEQLAIWRSRRSERFREWASQLVPLLPELKALFGQEQLASPRSGTEADSQLRLGVEFLVRALASEETPLVLFLDDLQWADHETIGLLEAIARSPGLTHILLLGAYRIADVDGAHPLVSPLERIEAEVPVFRMHLGSLSEYDVQTLVSDTFCPASADPTLLANELYTQTGGNAFFVRLMLQTLHEQRIVRFNTISRGWEWEIEQVRESGLPDDLATVIASRLSSFDEQTQEVLEIAACIGSDFDLELLALSLGSGPRRVATALLSAAQQGIVRTVGQSYKYLPDEHELDLESPEGHDVVKSIRYRFQHDNIQLAAYSRIPKASLPALHLKTGRLLLSQGVNADDGEVLYSLAHHLNLGSTAMLDDNERINAARVNLRVGQLARSHSAWEIAHRHFSCGLAHLPDDSWAMQFELTFELHRGLMEVEHFQGDNDSAGKLMALLLGQARGEMQIAQLLEFRVIIEMRAARHEAMLRTAQEGLATLGYSVPRSGSLPALLREFASIRWKLQTVELQTYLNGPRLANPKLALAMGFLVRINHATTYTGSRVGPLALLRIAKESLHRGRTDFSSVGFAVLAYVTTSVFGDLEAGRRYAELALALAERRGDAWADATANVFVGLIGPWIYTLERANELLDQAFEQAFSAGILQSAYFYAGLSMMFRWYRGVNLEALAARCERISPGALRYGQAFATLAPLVVTSRFTQCLRGETRSLSDLSSDGWDESDFVKNLRSTGNALALELFASLKAEVLYFAGDEHGAWRWLDEASQHVSPQTRNSLNAVSRVFFWGLIAARRGHASNAALRKDALVDLRRAVRKISRYRERNPRAFTAYELILRGEQARLSGKGGAARDLYDEAIEIARRQGSQKLEALALELAARSCLAQEREFVGELYLRASRLAYSRWGAQAKVNALVQEYPAILTSNDESLTFETHSSTKSTTQGETIDVAAIVEASRAISSELLLDNLLRRLISIVVQNAGAQRGVVLLESSSELRIEADCDVESQSLRILESTSMREKLCESIVRLVARTRSSVVLNDATKDPRFGHDPYVQRSRVHSVLCAALEHHGTLKGVLYLESRTSGAFTSEHIDLVKQLAGQITISVENARLYSDLEQTLTQREGLLTSQRRFIPDAFLKNLGRGDISEVVVGDTVTKRMSVLFSDIRGFTNLAERMSPEETFSFLNEYISFMEPEIHCAGGFIDSYIGDAIMALFEEKVEAPIEAALGMLRAQRRYNSLRSQRGEAPIYTSIGINTGEMTLGIIGVARRLKCSVIGDCVNVAARIEQLNRRYGTAILIGEECRRWLQDPSRFSLRFVDRVRVVGRSDPVTIYEVYDEDPEDVRSAKQESSSAFHEGVAAYYDRRLAEAEGHFRSLLSSLQGDPVVMRFLRRCEQAREEPLPTDWDGVETLEGKQ